MPRNILSFSFLLAVLIFLPLILPSSAIGQYASRPQLTVDCPSSATVGQSFDVKLTGTNNTGINYKQSGFQAFLDKSVVSINNVVIVEDNIQTNLQDIGAYIVSGSLTPTWPNGASDYFRLRITPSAAGVLHITSQAIYEGTAMNGSSCAIQVASKCINKCNLGQTQCSGSGYQTCTNTGSCNDWGAVTYCGYNQTCQGGNCLQKESCSDGIKNQNETDVDCGGVCSPCTPKCQNMCLSGQKKCNGEGYQFCSDINNDGCFEWSSKQPCGVNETCQSEGNCILTSQQPTTVWQPPVQDIPTSAIGANGQSSPQCQNACSRGQRRCDGEGYQVCSDHNGDGCSEWGLFEPCGNNEVCRGNGVCTVIAQTQVIGNSCNNQCNAGEKRCNENGYQTCNSNSPCNTWGAVFYCGLNQSCQDGNCVSYATCWDGIKNQSESDVDCGGNCGACANGRRCYNNANCQSGKCQNNVCITYSTPPAPVTSPTVNTTNNRAVQDIPVSNVPNDQISTNKPQTLPYSPNSYTNAGSGLISANLLIPQTFTFQNYLNIGIQDIQVYYLQKLLNHIGYTVANAGNGSLGNETYYFGTLTQAALARFQRANGLQASGALDSATRAALNDRLTGKKQSSSSSSSSSNNPSNSNSNNWIDPIYSKSTGYTGSVNSTPVTCAGGVCEGYIDIVDPVNFVVDVGKATWDGAKNCAVNHNTQECLSTCGIVFDAAVATAPISAACDLTNGVIYLFKGDKMAAGASLFAVIPYVGSVGKQGIKTSVRLSKEASEAVVEAAVKAITKEDRGIIEVALKTINKSDNISGVVNIWGKLSPDVQAGFLRVAKSAKGSSNVAKGAKFQLSRIIDLGPENIKSIEDATTEIVNGVEIGVRYDVVMKDGTIYEFKNWNWRNYSNSLTDTVRNKLEKQIDIYAKSNSEVVLEFSNEAPSWAFELMDDYKNLIVKAVPF